MFFELITSSLKLFRKPYNQCRYITRIESVSSSEVKTDENITQKQFSLSLENTRRYRKVKSLKVKVESPIRYTGV